MALTAEGADLLPLPHAGPALVHREEVLRGAGLAVAVALLGAPVGILWASVTPRAGLMQFANGGIGLREVEDKAFIATDGTFFLLTLGLGLVLGVVAWLVGRRWAVGAIVGAVLGAAIASAIALKAGQVFDARLGSFDDHNRTLAEGLPLTLPNELLPHSHHSWLLTLGWPAGIALGFAAMAIWRIGPAEHAPVSWGRPQSGRSREWAQPAGPEAGSPPA